MTSAISKLDSIISDWPKVKQRPTKTQIVFSVHGNSFCWLSPESDKVQLSPPLGKKSNPVRLLKRDGNKVKIINWKTGRIDAVFDDPFNLLKWHCSYPGFDTKKDMLGAYVNLIRQSYKRVMEKPTE